MPIDLMSPVQALESAALKLVAKKESDKHLAIAQMNADTKRMQAETYKQAVDKQLTPEQKLQISDNDVAISKNKKSIHLADARKSKNTLELQRILNDPQNSYTPNSDEIKELVNNKRNIANNFIRDSQAKIIGGDE